MSPFELTSFHEQVEVLRSILKVLSPREALVIEWIYWEGIDRRTIANSVGVQRQQIYRLESQALIKLKHEYTKMECTDRTGNLVYECLINVPWIREMLWTYDDLG